MRTWICCVGIYASTMVGVSTLGQAAPPPGTATSKEDALARLRTVNDLRQLSLALVDIYEESERLPPVDGSEMAGHPSYVGLSWRAYAAVRSDSDKNDPKDQRLVRDWIEGRSKLKQPKVRWNQPELETIRLDPFSCRIPGKVNKPWLTYYRVFVGGGAAFEKGKPAVLTKPYFPDGLENTILIVEAGEAVPWPKPDELQYDPAKPLPKLGGHFADGFYAVFADTRPPTVRFIAKDTDEKLIRAWITRNGGEKVDLPPAVDVDGLRKAAGIK